LTFGLGAESAEKNTSVEEKLRIVYFGNTTSAFTEQLS